MTAEELRQWAVGRVIGVSSVRTPVVAIIATAACLVEYIERGTLPEPDGRVWTMALGDDDGAWIKAFGGLCCTDPPAPSEPRPEAA